MKIQLALDRMTIEEAIEVASKAAPHVDILETGTSLIKEFGMSSVQKLKEAFPDKHVLADMKTMDNAVYECGLCFDAGADIMTVMGASPIQTVEACVNEAEKRGKQVMIDLLNTTAEQREELAVFKQAVFCEHVSKDEQEMTGARLAFTGGRLKTAAAGGLTPESISRMNELPDILIIGSAITKAENPGLAAEKLRALILEKEAMQ
ncbi:3-hexulose-6-phosphate synthase [Metabacillus indicus]|uniref:3-hexulose-6-phosphate synthase n=1 Tax=Metabacillus indicus TaxID=246786 RepID=UPI003CF505CF